MLDIVVQSSSPTSSPQGLGCRVPLALSYRSKTIPTPLPCGYGRSQLILACSLGGLLDVHGPVGPLWFYFQTPVIRRHRLAAGLLARLSLYSPPTYLILATSFFFSCTLMNPRIADAGSLDWLAGVWARHILAQLVPSKTVLRTYPANIPGSMPLTRPIPASWSVCQCTGLAAQGMSLSKPKATSLRGGFVDGASI